MISVHYAGALRMWDEVGFLLTCVEYHSFDSLACASHGWDCPVSSATAHFQQLLHQQGAFAVFQVFLVLCNSLLFVFFTLFTWASSLHNGFTVFFLFWRKLPNFSSMRAFFSCRLVSSSCRTTVFFLQSMDDSGCTYALLVSEVAFRQFILPLTHPVSLFRWWLFSLDIAS